MMSYRSIKRLLGETSLERKCRFLFGSGLLLLITGSFYFYARMTSRLVYEQNRITARLLVPTIILDKHLRWFERKGRNPIQLFWPLTEQPPVAIAPQEQSEQLIGDMVASLKPEDLKEYNWQLLKLDLDDPTSRPPDEAGYEALSGLRKGEAEVERILRDEYRYYAGVRAAKSCMQCHVARQADLQENDLLGMVAISFPMARTKKSLAWNNAILLATAIVTAFLAMLGAYAIVRYVIVKPVLYLKDISEAIAQGDLERRAEIHTGDEFEELSQAFNRMLRYLENVQDELREVNQSLDSKLDELAHMNLELYEMNNLKNEFLATMSHELRTPLNSILGFSDVLLGAQNLPDRQRRYVANIQTSGRQLLNLINDVLDLAKIESGKMELHPVEFSVADLVERMVGSMLPLAERKQIDLSWQSEPNVPVLLQDVGKLQQILNNLLSNAIKFTPDGGRVRVRARLRDAETFILTVEDTGIGIPLEDQERIFEKFRQGRMSRGADTALTRDFEGTGLGLSIVQELAKLLGGDVALESEFGKGSTFSVTLPVRLPDTPAAPALNRAIETSSVTP